MYLPNRELFKKLILVLQCGIDTNLKIEGIGKETPPPPFPGFGI